VTLANSPRFSRLGRGRSAKLASAFQEAPMSTKLPDLPEDMRRPEPKEIDEKLSLQLRHLADDAVLKGEPYGEERCQNCHYYSEVDKKISYCWHMKLRILVGAEWWCQWWEKIEE
jgi:hypothetical protein